MILLKCTDKGEGNFTVQGWSNCRYPADEIAAVLKAMEQKYPEEFADALEMLMDDVMEVSHGK